MSKNLIVEPSHISFSIGYEGEPDDQYDSNMIRSVNLLGGSVESLCFDYTTWVRRIKFQFSDIVTAEGAQRFMAHNSSDKLVEVNALTRGATGEILH